MDNKLIQQSDYDKINELVPDCEQAAKACGNSLPFDYDELLKALSLVDHNELGMVFQAQMVNLLVKLHILIAKRYSTGSSKLLVI